MRRLIVNADDLGWGPGVNRGILAAHQAGALPSATILAAGAAFEDAVEGALRHPGLGIGVHLALAGLPPVCPPAEVPTLVGPGGTLWPSLGAFTARWIRGRIRPDDVRRELAAQVEKVLAAGIRPTHVDGHKHVQVVPGVQAIVLELCRRYGIPALRAPFDDDPLFLGLAPPSHRTAVCRQWLMGRALRPGRGAWRRRAAKAGLAFPDRFHGVAFTGHWTRAYLDTVTAALPEGVTELMAHPGFLDDDLRRGATRLRESRQQELELLMGVLPGLLRQRGIECCNYTILCQKGSHP